jgi:pterin-4a-carbinolamine dehydratase
MHRKSNFKSGKNLDFEKAVKSTTFLKTEVCVRIAHIVKELEHLPKILLRMNSVQLVRKW